MYKKIRELTCVVPLIIFCLIIGTTSCDNNNGGDKIVQPDPNEEEGRDGTPPG